MGSMQQLYIRGIQSSAIGWLASLIPISNILSEISLELSSIEGDTYVF
jgi:hypothetical protein